MKVNGDKFLYTVFCRHKRFCKACVQVGNNEIKSSSYTKQHVLGMQFDQKLIFIVIWMNCVEKPGGRCLH